MDLTVYRNINTHSFCHQDEEHDPSPEFEEYLACAVCGDNGIVIHRIPLNLCDTNKVCTAHRQCARDAEALEADEGAAHWNGLWVLTDHFRCCEMALPRMCVQCPGTGNYKPGNSIGNHPPKVISTKASTRLTPFPERGY